MNRMMKKLKSQAGESIAEVLVALVVAAIGVVMAIGAISSSTKSMNKADDTISNYYKSETEMIEGAGDTATVTITFKSASEDIVKTRDVSIRKAEFNDSKTIYAYEAN